MLLYRWLNFKK